MKKIFIPIIIIAINACGPAAESRERMDTRAKRTSDSIQQSVDSMLKAPMKEISANTIPAATVTTMPETIVKTN